MDYSFDYSKLRGRIVEKFGTLKAFYEHLHITPEMAYRKLNGIAGFSQNDIVEWCGLLGIALKEVGIYFFTLKV